MKSLVITVRCLLVIVVLTDFAGSLPLEEFQSPESLNDNERSSEKENASDGGAAALLPFLKRFGYLESSNSSHSHESDSLYTQESVTKAVKEMQKFGALPETGMLDDATLALLTKPRCGIPDVLHRENPGMDRIKKRFVIGSKGWNKRRITYRVENWSSQMSETDVLEEVRLAFEAWAKYARLRFVNVPRLNRDDVDIAMSFGRGYHGDGYPFDGTGGVLAHAFFPYTHGSLGGDVHFDLDENWKSLNNHSNNWDSNSGYPTSFLAVAIHEIGHSLGLAHSPSQDSVMFPYYQSFEQGAKGGEVRLGHDDIMAMYQLYIQREIEDFPDEDDVPVTHGTTEATPHSTTTYTDRTTSSYETTTSRKESTNEPVATTEKTTLRPTTHDDEDEPIPKLCDDGFDTMSFIRNEIFVFKNKYMWRLQERGVQDRVYPVKTSRLFPMLSNIDKIDAAFENEENNIIFISGNQYWVYDKTETPQLATSRPHRISDYGLPEDLHKIDAVFIWGKNKKLYFFSGSLFWKYDTSRKEMEEGYPKSIQRWSGLPDSGIDSVLTWSDEKTYFFKDKQFWRFDDIGVHTEEGYPLQTLPYWFGC